MQEVSGGARTHDLWVCIQCARDPTYTSLASLCVTTRGAIGGNRESRVQFTHGKGKLELC